MSEAGFEAVILAGGSGLRLGGRDKAALRFQGGTLLDHVLAAVAGADRIVCVGPRRATAVEVTWTREDPPGGGPVAALAAAIPLLSASAVVVLACDLPFVERDTVRRLLDSMHADGAMLSDERGRAQFLAAAYRREMLASRLAAMDVNGASMGSLLRGADLTEVAGGAAARDVDTPEDLARLSLPGGDR